MRFSRYNREATYQQPFRPDGQRLCLNCAAPVPGAEALTANAVLEGMVHLFCRYVACSSRSSVCWPC